MADAMADKVLYKGNRYELVLKAERPACIASTAEKVLESWLGMEGTSFFEKIPVGKEWTNPKNLKRVFVHSKKREPRFVDGVSNGEFWTLIVEPIDNPVPVLAIVAGIAILIGLYEAYLSLDTIKDIAESNPIAAIGLSWFPMLLLFAVVAFFTRDIWMEPLRKQLQKLF